MDAVGTYDYSPNDTYGQVATCPCHYHMPILEIGPGTGILTEKLLANNVGVYCNTPLPILAIEKDRNLYKLLQKRFKSAIQNQKLILINDDFVHLDFTALLKKYGFEAQKYRVITNLPYQITSPTLEILLEQNFLPAEILLTIQKEVAERICANPGKLSSLAVMVQNIAQKVEIISHFPPSFFYPEPEVHSSLIRLSSLSYPPKVEIKKLRRLIHAGFSQKRKKLKKNLANILGLDEVNLIWQKLKLSENLRAQELPAQKWLDIYKLVFI